MRFLRSILRRLRALFGHDDASAERERRAEAVRRINGEVMERLEDGLPPVPSEPVKGVPYVAPRIPPGKVRGATASRVTLADLAELDDEPGEI